MASFNLSWSSDSLIPSNKLAVSPKLDLSFIEPTTVNKITWRYFQMDLRVVSEIPAQLYNSLKSTLGKKTVFMEESALNISSF